MLVAGPASYRLISAIPLLPSHITSTMPRNCATSQSHIQGFFSVPALATSQSYTKGSFSGPALTIMSFNIEGLSAAKQQLVADLSKKHECAVLCIQETHRGPDDIRPNIPGMELAIERPNAQYGSAIFVKSGTIINATSLTDVNNIENLRVDLSGISVTSVYKPPGELFSFDQPPTVVGNQPQVFFGDFNSHNELVVDWAEIYAVNLIHNPKLPSSFNSGRWRRGYNPDLIFASNRIAGCCNKFVMNPVPRSQHRPIGVQVNAAVNVQTVTFRRRFNLKKANWMWQWKTSPPQPKATTSL